MPDNDVAVAVIGLGKMGSAVATRILAAGFPLTVFNRTNAKAAPLVAGGALWGASPREAAAGADIVITSLMDDQSVAAAMAGDDGILRGLKPGGIHLCATTISPQQSIALGAAHTAHGSRYLAGPLVGRPAAVAAGNLSTLISGPADALEHCRPVIASYAANIVYLGADCATANNAKLLANYVAYASLELIGQVYAYAERCGIAAAFPHQMLAGTFAHPAVREYNERIAARRYDDPGFDTRGGLKDLDLIHDASMAAGAPLAYAGVVRDRFLAATANGFGAADFCSIAEITRGLAGLDTAWTAHR